MSTLMAWDGLWQLKPFITDGFAVSDLSFKRRSRMYGHYEMNPPHFGLFQRCRSPHSSVL